MITFRERVSRLVLRNVGLKLVALLAAVLLWMAVASEPMAEIGMTVPVEYHNVPPDMEIITDNAQQVTLRLRGPDSQVRGLTAADVHVEVDLAVAARQALGERTLELSASQVQVPMGIEIVNISPTYIRASFDRRASRMVPVRPRVIGSFAQGFELSKVVAEPAEVSIVGPESRVRQVDAAVTDAIDASGVVGSNSYAVVVFAPDPLVRVARPSQVRVTVTTARVTAPAAAETEKTDSGKDR